MSDDKSPGNDGLTKAFFVHFWDNISSMLLERLLASKQEGRIAPAPRQDVIKLIEN